MQNLGALRRRASRLPVHPPGAVAFLLLASCVSPRFLAAVPGATAPGVFAPAFEPNVGQADTEAQFVGRVGGAVVWIGRGELTLAHSGGAGTVELHRVRFRDADLSAPVSGEQPLPGVSHYFQSADPSRWRRGVARFGRVRVDEIYPGIDLVLHAANGALEYDFEVAPFADPRAIRLAFDAPLTLDDSGRLRVGNRPAAVAHRRPVAYQESNGQRNPVAAAFRIGADPETEWAAFELGEFDSSRPLVIDPTLELSTYLGGGANETARDVAVTESGAIVLAGETLSLDLPVTAGVLDSSCGGATACAAIGDVSDCFIARLDSTATSVVWMTYLGGDGRDRCDAVATDADGNIFVAGSSGSDYPTTAGAFQVAPGCGTDGTVSKLSPSGATLLYSTYVGGGCGGDTSQWHSDSFFDLAVDAAGRALVAGTSNSTSYPTTPGAFDPVCGVQPFCDGVSPHFDGVVSALDPAGSALAFSTFLGGSQNDYAKGIAVSPAGEAFVTGWTESYYASPTPLPPGQTPFPTTPGAFQGAPTTPGRRGFLARLSSAGTALVYSTMLGGSSTEPEDVELGPGGYAFVVGSTGDRFFPTLPPRTLATSNLSVYLGFVTKFAPAGGSLVYSTLIGNELETSTGARLRDIAVDPLGKAYAVGFATADSYPLNEPLQPALAGGQDAVLTVLQPNGAGQLSPTSSSFFHSTYLGGTGDDEALGVALSSPGEVVLVGVTGSSDFPLQSPIEPAPLGGRDAFVARVTDTTTNLIFADGFGWGDSSAWSQALP